MLTKEQIESLEVGDLVQKIATDYTNGRIGKVIEICKSTEQVRVAWKKGTSVVKTAVSFSRIKIV